MIIRYKFEVEKPTYDEIRWARQRVNGWPTFWSEHYNLLL